MSLDIYPTHIELSPYLKGDLPALEDMYTAMDRFTQTEKPCGYILEKNRLFLPRGTPISKLEVWSEQRANHDTVIDPIAKMSRKHHSLYELRNELQELSVHFLLTNDNPQLALNLPTGFGKALANSTRIPTPTGKCAMGELKVGSTVFGANGRPTNVIGVYPQGKRDIYKVTFEDGRTSYCDNDHLWEVFIDDAYHTMSLDEIKQIIHSRDCHIPLAHAIQYPSIEESSDPKTIVYDIIHELIDRIPAACMMWSIPSRFIILWGIIAKYGKMIDDTLSFVSDNKVLFDQVCELQYSLGNMAHTSTIVINNQTHHVMQFRESSSNMMQIVDIQFSHIEEATCIKVDAPDQLFLTEDFIVTHNTFCVVYAATSMGQRCLVVTPNETLKQQWIQTCRNMFDYKLDDIRNVAGSDIMSMIVDGSLPPADIYCINHQTLRSYLNQFGPERFHDFFRKIKIGMKVYDESHLEFGNILLVDSFSNTAKTWYLTATFDRSDKSESVCFKQAFSSVTPFGEVEGSKVVEKHVLYHVVNIHSHPDYKAMREVIKFNGMTAATYGKYAFMIDHNDTAYRTVLAILNKVKTLEGKTLIFIPLIEAVDSVANKLRVDFPDKTVGVYHSKISKDEKESTLKKDIIVSTIKSCGTGKDIPGLRVVINCEPLASKVQAQQLIGRLRPYGKDMMTYFFDVIDVGIPAVNWWFRARYRKIQTLVKQTIYIDRTKSDD